MHHDLAVRFVEVQALLLTPIAPHIAEHLWSTVLSNTSSVQLAQFPKAFPTPEEDRFIVDAGVYVRTAIKNIRDAELKFHKNKAKGKTGGSYDPSKPKGIKVYVSSGFPEWQETAVGIVKESFDGSKVDDKKVKEELEKRGLIKEKKYMPFVAMFKVCCEAFNLTLSLALTPLYLQTEKARPIRSNSRLQPSRSLQRKRSFRNCHALHCSTARYRQHSSQLGQGCRR